MSATITRAGLLDTIQDAGRYGYQHWGINPGGAMDMVAMQAANMLAGNDRFGPVIEMHFPAAEIRFDTPALIAIAGAEFSAQINEKPFSTNRAVIVAEGDVLKFTKQVTGSRVYLAVNGGILCNEWLQSASTNLVAKAGGMQGRALQKADVLLWKEQMLTPVSRKGPLPWCADIHEVYGRTTIRFIAGEEYRYVEQGLGGTDSVFAISRTSNRMGYRLLGEQIAYSGKGQLVSTAVTMGTIQLLPDGQLIVLMADHQTTGGYPRIGHVITADLPGLSQMAPGQELRFEEVDQSTAEQLLYRQQMDLRLLQNACTFRLQDYLEQECIR